MSYFILLRMVLLLCLSSDVRCDKLRWLMHGDLWTNKDTISRGVGLDTNKIYYHVSRSVDLSYKAKDGKKITCIIAAATNMKGWVSLIEGGLNLQSAKFRYVTENGEPDIFFILVESMKQDSVTINEDFIENSRYGIAYEPMKNWTLGEIRAIAPN